jgi:RNA polymerase sigma-70 factor, ECF subfamily
MIHQLKIENEIIENCRKGSMQDFRKLVDIVSPFAFSVAFRLLGDKEQAKDTVQETMITIWEKISKIKSRASFQAWMYRIVVNKCYDQLRNRKRNPEQRADEKGWALISNKISESPSSALENAQISQIINLLTEKLSPKQKAVFVLSDLEEMSNDEVSLITGLSKTNVKANLHFARKKIGELIEKYV